jgi:hypothetical protein
MMISSGAIGEAHRYARFYVAPIHTPTCIFSSQRRSAFLFTVFYVIDASSVQNIRQRWCKPRCRCSARQPLAWLNITPTYWYLCYKETNYSNATVRRVLLNLSGAFSVRADLRHPLSQRLGAPADTKISSLLFSLSLAKRTVEEAITAKQRDQLNISISNLNSNFFCPVLIRPSIFLVSWNMVE